MKYIDAEALKAELSKAPVWTTLAVKEMIDKASGCVTCKECKHRTYCYGDVLWTNKRQTVDIHKDIDFCSYGERKESE